MVFFIVTVALAVTVPWYVALIVIGGALIASGWHELLVVALLADVSMGAGIQLSAIPIVTLSACAIVLIRTLIAPYLLSSTSLTQV